MVFSCISKLISCVILNGIGMNHSTKSIINPIDTFVIDRRSTITTIVSTIVNAAIDRPVQAYTYTNLEQSIVLPLERCGGGGMCVRYTIFGSSSSSSFRVIKAIVDTGSPYVVIPDGDDDGFDLPKMDPNPILKALNLLISINDMKLFLDESEYLPTEEIYGSQLGEIKWKKARIQFREPNLINESDKLILGVMDNALTKESGGALLGLVKHSNIESNKVQIRPTFLQQEKIQSEQILPITSFIFDPPNKSLTLSNQSLLPKLDEINYQNIIPLIDLRPLGDFVEHYACYVQHFFLNGVEIKSNKRNIVAVFDSGLTGCLLTQSLWDEIKKDGIIKPNQIDFLEVQINTIRNQKKSFQNSQKLVSIASSKSKSPFFYVSPISLDWFDDDITAPHVIVLGQAFLQYGALTIDIENRKALFEEYMNK